MVVNLSLFLFLSFKVKFTKSSFGIIIIIVDPFVNYSCYFDQITLFQMVLDWWGGSRWKFFWYNHHHPTLCVSIFFHHDGGTHRNLESDFA